MKPFHSTINLPRTYFRPSVSLPNSMIQVSPDGAFMNSQENIFFHKDTTTLPSHNIAFTRVAFSYIQQPDNRVHYSLCVTRFMWLCRPGRCNVGIAKSWMINSSPPLRIFPLVNPAVRPPPLDAFPSPFAPSCRPEEKYSSCPRRAKPAKTILRRGDCGSSLSSVQTSRQVRRSAFFFQRVFHHQSR